MTLSVYLSDGFIGEDKESAGGAIFDQTMDVKFFYFHPVLHVLLTMLNF